MKIGRVFVSIALSWLYEALGGVPPHDSREPHLTVAKRIL
jgi:hypothetical protein